MFSQLLEAVTFDAVRVGLRAYDDLLGYYRPLFYVAVSIWVLNITLEVLQTHQLKAVLLRLVRGAVVIAYLSSPQVPQLFADILQAPSRSSGVVIEHIVSERHGPRTAPTAPSCSRRGDFGASVDCVIEIVNEKAERQLSNMGFLALNWTVFVLIGSLYAFLIAFLAVVLYVAALATFYQAALLFLLPLAVTLYPWAYTRPLFDGVIRQGISFALVFPLLQVLLAVVVSPLTWALDDLSTGWVALIPFACMCVVGALLALQIPALASGVAGGVGVPLLRLR